MSTKMGKLFTAARGSVRSTLNRINDAKENYNDEDRLNNLKVALQSAQEAVLRVEALIIAVEESTK